MEGISVFFLHGFLGKPSDWGPIQQKIRNELNIQSLAVDYFNHESLGPFYDFEQWGKNFNQFAQSLSAPNSKKILVGYSLGGRLALHALENKPDVWNHVVCLSTNPGFEDYAEGFDPLSDERRQRRINDTIWAEEFESAPWEQVMKKWNAQSIFGKSAHEPHRRESDYDKKLLSLALTQWSLSKQRNLRSLVMRNLDRLHWYVGDRDDKYIQLAQSIVQKTNKLDWGLIPESTHRVVFDNPQFIANRLAEVIRKS